MLPPKISTVLAVQATPSPSPEKKKRKKKLLDRTKISEKDWKRTLRFGDRLGLGRTATSFLLPCFLLLPPTRNGGGRGGHSASKAKRLEDGRGGCGFRQDLPLPWGRGAGLPATALVPSPGPNIRRTPLVASPISRVRRLLPAEARGGDDLGLRLCVRPNACQLPLETARPIPSLRPAAQFTTA